MTLRRLFILRNNDIKARAVQFLADLPDDGTVYEVLIKVHDPKRSNDQNELAHVIVTAIQEQVWLPDEQGKKRQFCLEAWWLQLKKNYFHPEILELPDGTFTELEPRSRDKGTKTFKKWVDYLFQFAAEADVRILEEKLDELRWSEHG